MTNFAAVMNEQEQFTHVITLPGRRAGHALVLTYEAAKRLGWNFVTIRSGEITCLLRDGDGTGEITIRFSFAAGTVTFLCAAATAQARQLAAAFEKTVTGLSRLADTDTLDEEYRALHHAYFAGEQPEQQEPPGLAGIIRPAAGYRVTPVLLLINVFILFVMVGSGVSWLMPDPEVMVQWGANYKPLTLNGDWWRLLTAGFLHYGIIHLAMNMFALFQIGQTIERFIGSWRFLIAYLIALVSGNVLSLAWNDISISAGASGAVFGMFGVFLALLTTKLIARSVRRSLLMSMISVIGFNLLFGLQAGIDNAGHIGGLIGGILAGYAMVPALRRHDKSLRGYVLLLLLGLVVAAVASFTISKLPNDFPAYEKRMQKMQQLEEKALALYILPEQTPDSVIVRKLREDVIPAWDSCGKIADEIALLNLPDYLLEHNKLFKRYCQYRAEHSKMMFVFYFGKDSTLLPYIEEAKQKIDSLKGALNSAEEKK